MWDFVVWQGRHGDKMVAMGERCQMAKAVMLEACEIRL